MVDFDQDAAYKRAAANPAGPSGLRQTASSIEEGRAAYAKDPTALQPWQPESSWAESAKTWYTGANQESTTNGWDSDFWRAAWATMDETNKAAEETGKASTWFQMFDRPNATGVAQWDDPQGRYAFGDVMEKGQWRTNDDGSRMNVYTSYDKATADLMMGAFMFDGDQQKRMFASPDRLDQVAQAVEGRRQENNDFATNAPSAEAYNAEVEEVEQGFRDSIWDEIATFAAGAVGGVIEGGPNPWGMLAGGLVGGPAALMNKDQIANLTARAVVQARRAGDYSDSPFTRVGSTVGAFAPVTQRFISPLSNLVQGTEDILSPKGWGDDETEAGFYRVNSIGERETGGFVQGLDIAASFGDSVLQFSNPAARGVYMATMGMAVTGGVADQVMGATFNPRIGRYDPFDTAGERMAALGSTSIDLLQMGMARMLGSSAASVRAAAGMEASRPLVGQGLAERIGDRVLGRASMRGAANYETLNGVRFALDDQLNVVGSRMTMQALVPSEFMRWLPTSWMARRYARNAGRTAPNRDDLYEAAWMLAGRQSRTRSAIINAYAEGSEEFIQAILDPWATGNTPQMQDIVSATLYGAAGGGGMSFGRVNQRPTGDAFSKEIARNLYGSRMQRAVPREEFDQIWAGATDLEKRRMSTMSQAEAREMGMVYEAQAQLMEMDATYNSVIGIQNLSNLSRSTFDTMHKRASEAGVGSLVLMPMSAGTVIMPGGFREAQEYAPNAAVMSLHQVGLELAGIARGMEGQVEALQANQEKLLVDRDKLGTDAAAMLEREKIQARIDEHQAMIDDIQAGLPAADQLMGIFSSMVEKYRATADRDQRRRIIANINELLLRAGQGRWMNTVNGQQKQLPPEEQDLIRRAVELNVGRHPLMGKGSFGIYIPQVSVALTEQNVHSTMFMHHSQLKAPNADHDGDLGVVEHTKYLTPTARRDLRRGEQFVDEGISDVDDARLSAIDNMPASGRTKAKALVDMPDNEARVVRLFSEAMKDPNAVAGKQVSHELNKLVRQLRQVLSQSRGGPIADQAVDDLLAAFRQGIVDGDPSARETFLNGLLNSQPNAVADLLAMADSRPELRGQPFIPWFMWNVNFAFDRIQRNLATRFQTDPTAIEIAPMTEQMQAASAAYMEQVAVRNAQTIGQQLTDTINPVRASQRLHYSGLYRSLTIAGIRESEGSFTTAEQEELVRQYAEWGSGIVRSELDMTMSKDSIERNTLTFLNRIVAEIGDELGARTEPELRLLIANLQVPDIRPVDGGGYTVEVGSTSLLQILLRKAIEIEEANLTGTPVDSPARARIAKLRAMAYPKKDGHSYTASTVLVEIFGSENLFDLVGDTSMFLGSEMTLDQFIKLMTSRSDLSRRQFFHNLKRSSGYIKNDDIIKDPPWSFEQLQSMQVNAFAILIDAAKAHIDTSEANRGRRDERISENMRKGLRHLRNAVAAWQSSNPHLPAGPSEAARIAVLRDLLEKRPAAVAQLSDLIPSAASLGVFERMPDGTVRQPKWLEKALVMEDEAAAEVLIYVELKLAEFNQMGGSVRTDTVGGEKQQTRGTVRYSQIKSRFLQTVYYLARTPNSLELSRFLKMATQAGSLESLFAQINAEPDWLNNRMPLLPYHDDVGLYETQPEDIWQADLPYALQREAVEAFPGSMQMLETSVTAAAEFALANRVAITGMQAVEAGTSTDPRHVEMLNQLDERIKMLRSFPDGVGPRARDMLLELFTESLIRLHDKGKIDERARGFGESMVVLDAYGWKGGLMQGVDAVTAFDWEDVVSNLTKLVEGPLRLQLEDGSIVTLDMSTKAGALKMLADPRTQQFAMAVLQPTVRDLNSAGTMQVYRDLGLRGEDALSLENILAPQALRRSLFDDEGSRVEQAYRYIGMIENYLRKEALNSDQEDIDDYVKANDAAHGVVMNMISEIMVAYTQGPTWSTTDKRELRDRLVVQVADAIKSMANVEATSHASIREKVAAALQLQLTGNADALEFATMDQDQREEAVADLRTFIVQSLDDEMETLQKLQDAEFAAAPNDVEQKRVLAKYAAMREEVQERYARYEIGDNGIQLVSGHLSTVVQSIINSMQLTGQRDADLVRKVQILNILGKNNRTNRFRTKDTIELYHKVRRIIYSDNMNLFRNAAGPDAVSGIDDITLDEWNILGGWAATASISDLTSRGSSEVALLPLVFGNKGDQIRRLYDISYSYLLDGFFNPAVLDVAKKLATQAGVRIPTTSQDMIDQFMYGLFAEGKLGPWTDRVPLESLKQRGVIDSASTGAAIQVEGNDPKELAPYLAAGRVSTLLPDPAEHHSQTVFTGTLGASLLGNSVELLKLGGHFASRVMLDVSQVDPAIVASIDPADLDLMTSLAKNDFNAEVANSPYRVFSLTAIFDRLEMLQAKYGEIGPVTLLVDYVDGDKQPAGPGDFEWANNIFFVGIGRDGFRTSEFGAIAALYFGTSGLSKLGQQNPLDAATKKGKRFRATLTPPLTSVENAEATGATISEILWNKTKLLMAANYSTGKLLIEDAPAIFELMKMRHVIVGKNASGEKEVWWPQRLIEMQAQGTAIPLTEIKLVPLNDSIAQQLHSGQSHAGLRTRVSQRTLNLQDIQPFASLDAARLKGLGLSRLGDAAEAWQSPVTQVGSLLPATLAREEESKANSISQRRARWESHLEGVRAERSQSRSTGKGKFNPAKNNKKNLSTISELLSPDTIGSLMRRMRVPFSELGRSSDALTMKLLNNLRYNAEKLNSNTVVWYHEQNSGTDPASGVLGRVSTSNDSEFLQRIGPTYQDTVGINITSIERLYQDHEKALQAAKDVIRSYADLGLTVVLLAERGRKGLLNDLHAWMEAGSLGYRSVAGSLHFYVPVDEDPTVGETRRALNSTLTATSVIDPLGVSLGIVTNEASSQLSENGGFADLEHDPGSKRVVANMIPGRITATGSAGDNTQVSFAYPAEGDTAAWDLLRATLLPLLNDRAGIDHLVRLAGGYKTGTDGNPPGVPVYREIETTGEIIPGVLDLRQALEQLRVILESKGQPLQAGQWLQLGSIIPSIGPADQILLNRIGFLPPDILRMQEMLKAPRGKNAGEPGDLGLGIAIAPAALDKNATIGPRFQVTKVRKSARGVTIIGEAEMTGYAKTILEGTGFKMGTVPMPSSLRFKDAVIKTIGAAGMRVTRLLSETSVIGKEATYGLADNFADMFMFGGVNFKDDLMTFFYGEDVTTESAADQSVKWDELQGLLDVWSHMDHGFTGEDVQRMLDHDFGQAELENKLNALGRQLWESRWTPVALTSAERGPETTNARIASILLAAMATPDLHLNHVLGTPGLIELASHQEGAGVRRLPALVTDALSDSSYPDVRRLMIGRVNAKMPDRPGKPGKVYWFDEQMNFHAILEEKISGAWTDREVIGQLQIQLPIVHDTTGDSLAYAALTSDVTLSPHVVNVQNAADGSYLVPRGKKLDAFGNPVNTLPDAMDEIFGDNEVLRFESGSGGVVWEMLTRILQDDPSYSPWERMLPAEAGYRLEANKKVRYYTKPIELEPSAAQVKAHAAADEMLQFLGLTNPSLAANRREIDFLVRQWYGAPAAENEFEEEAAKISAEEYFDAVTDMMKNLKNKFHPLHSADVPLEHVMFWRKVFEAQKRRPEAARWAPMRTESMKGGKAVQVPAESWAEWVESIMGQVMDSHEAFDGMFATALDGFYHTYQGATPDFLVTAMSLDEQRRARLMDPNVARALLAIDPGRDAVLSDPLLLELILPRPEESASRHERRKYQAEYREKNKITRQKASTVREYSRTGLQFQEGQRTSSEFLTGIVNLSVFMRLLNPALYVSAMIEVPFRNMLERMTNVAAGTYTGVGAAGISAIGEKLGSPSRYSVEELAIIDRLVERLGDSDMLLGEIFREMVYASPLKAKSAPGRLMERAATKVARFSSDPRWGMRANSAARRYIEAALTQLEMTGSPITVQQLANRMNANPLWLMEQSGEGFNAHVAGVNAVAQVRSMRPTVASRAVMAPIDRMTNSGSGFVNGSGHLLKIPFLFTRFNINLLMTMTGLDALDQTAAMLMDGRKAPELIKRMGALSRGTEYDAAGARRMNYEDVIQGIDISRVFVRSAVTQTGLMTAALMAAGMGLGGDDEEERRRRKLAHYLHVPFILDPRKAQNDFRFADAIFLDNVPALSDIPIIGSLPFVDKIPSLSSIYHKQGIDRAVVQPHWIMKQFLSPVLGTMRFFQTGDVREIGYGFWDAAAAIPNSAVNLWREADTTSDLLAAAAQDASLDPQKDQQVNQLLINIVGMYEKALIENQFANAVRQAMDPLDRNPWLIPKTLDNGELDVTQGRALPQETNALVEVQTDGENGRDPENRMAYDVRTPADAQLHAYAEGNLTFSLLMSLFTGGTESSYLRSNMVPKEPVAYSDQSSQAEVEAGVLSAFMAQGGQPQLTQREILQTLRDKATASGKSWNDAELNQQAQAIYENQAALEFTPSIFDAAAMKVLNDDLTNGMFKSLRSGAVQLGDAVTSGFWADQTMRDNIAQEWLNELVEEGIALGLSQDSAKWRADRFYWGDTANGWVGLRELLYSNKIPSSGSVEYLQQNVGYVIGPDGMPWATPFEKSNLLGSVFPVPRQMVDPGPGLSLDSRGNVVDLVHDINTGLAGLLQKPTTAAKIKANDDILDEVKKKDFGDSTPYKKFGRRGYGGYGGGGGYSNFSRMYALPKAFASPRPDDIPFINVNTPYVRRARVNMERITADRGRLKQWQ